jgi:hypothetical protein
LTERRDARETSGPTSVQSYRESHNSMTRLVSYLLHSEATDAIKKLMKYLTLHDITFVDYWNTENRQTVDGSLDNLGVARIADALAEPLTSWLYFTFNTNLRQRFSWNVTVGIVFSNAGRHDPLYFWYVSVLLVHYIATPILLYSLVCLCCHLCSKSTCKSQHSSSINRIPKISPLIA